MKLDIAINYVCSWLVFDVSTLKQALKLCKTYDLSVFVAISLAVAFKEGKWIMGRIGYPVVLYYALWKIYTE